MLAAAITALIGHALGQSGQPSNVLADVTAAVTKTIDHKRQWVWVAVFFLAVGVGWGGVVTYLRYGSPEAKPESTATIELTAEGTAVVASLCEVDTETLMAESITPAMDSFEITKVKECDDTDLVLPTTAIAGGQRG